MRRAFLGKSEESPGTRSCVVLLATDAEDNVRAVVAVSVIAAAAAVDAVV